MRFSRARTSKSGISPLLTTLILLSVGGCGSDDPTGLVATAADMLGTWDLTSYTISSVPPGSSVELVSQGFSGVVEFRQDGSYTFTTTNSSQVDEAESATFTVSGSTLTLVTLGDVSTLEIQALSSTTATLFVADDEFDFNDDGTQTPATVTVQLAKQ